MVSRLEKYLYFEHLYLIATFAFSIYIYIYLLYFIYICMYIYLFTVIHTSVSCILMLEFYLSAVREANAS